MMKRTTRAILTASALLLGFTLAGCENFDPTTIFDSDIFSTKKKLQGERKPVFPDGTPGVPQGVPAELIKGHQQPVDPLQDPQQAAAPAEAQPEAKPAAKAEAKPKPKPKPRVVAKPPAQSTAAANTATSQPAPAAAQSPWPDPPRQQQPTAGGWPSSPTQPGGGGVAWPDPPAPR